jgi:hypothetical protein
MTRAQLEANFGWDPERGSIPFRRPLLTEKNIRDQQKLARAGTLIHWAGRFTCDRGKQGVDVVEDGNVTHTGLASYIENVNCLQCRRNYFDRRHR